MSQLTRFQQTVGPEVIAGNEPGTITINFNTMTQKDETIGSKYEMAGRMFFEASISGDSYTSFTTNGFFDKQGYTEPVSTSYF